MPKARPSKVKRRAAAPAPRLKKSREPAVRKKPVPIADESEDGDGDDAAFSRRKPSATARAKAAVKEAKERARERAGAKVKVKTTKPEDSDDAASAIVGGEDGEGLPPLPEFASGGAGGAGEYPPAYDEEADYVEAEHLADVPVAEVPRSEATRMQDLLRGLKGKPDGMENGLDANTLKDMLMTLRAIWLAPLQYAAAADAPAWLASIEAAIDRFELKDKAHGDVASGTFNLSVKDIMDAHRKTVFQLVRLQFCFRQRGIIESAAYQPGKKRGVEDLGGNSYTAMFAALMSAVSHFKDVLVSEMRLRRALDSSVNAADPTPPDPWRFVPLDLTALNPRQNFFLFLLNELQAVGYRRYNKACYEQIMSPAVFVEDDEVAADGSVTKVGRFKVFPTHAWRRVCDIKDFIREVATKEDRFEQWKNMTQPGNLQAAVEELENCHDVEFGELCMDRHWFAFQDGLLHTDTATFYGWGEAGIPADVVACRYFDAVFNVTFNDVSILEGTDWYAIDTPAIQSVLEYQLEHLKWDDRDPERRGAPNPEVMHEVIRWFYVLFGRLLYEVGEKDTWQVLLFIVGRAGTGKCLAPRTEVLLHDGRVKAAEDVVAGDLLMGDDSSPRTVLTTAAGTGPMFRVVPSTGRPFECNAPHVLTLCGDEPFIEHRPATRLPYVVQFTERGRIRYKCLATEAAATEFMAALPEDVFDMPLEEYMALPAAQQRYCYLYHAAVDYPAQAVPVDPYMIGYWLGDGTRASTTEVGAYVERISGSARDMLDDNKHIPLVYAANSRVVRLELLAGILDGGGHLVTDKDKDKDGYFEVTQKSERLARDIERLALSLGFMASFVPDRKACTYKGEGTYYRVTIHGDGLDHAPPCIPRHRVTRQRFGVEPLGEGAYVGWQLDGNARFLLADHTVTHNSTILDALADFFQPEDVEVLANKGRKGDGELQTFIDKFLWMCREVKNDLTLDQAQLQSMITGETMSISRLYGGNLTVTWRVPGVLAGNEAASWSDNSGSISRRVIMAFFERKVNPSISDPRLKHKVKAQMPQFLYKCCVAYLAAVGEFGERELWGTYTLPDGRACPILPSYFHAGKKRLQALTHPLENFLRANESITLLPTGSDGGMPWERFKELANLWMERNNIRGFQWKEEKFKNVLEENGLTRTKLQNGVEYQGRACKAGTYWLRGATESSALEGGVEGLEGLGDREVVADVEDVVVTDTEGQAAGRKRRGDGTSGNKAKRARKAADMT